MHVWRVLLDRTNDETVRFRALLDDSELRRADAFHFEHDRGHFTVARAVLRELLGAYLGTEPVDVTFSYSGHGKPHLADTSLEIRFNVSHSHGMALIAITRRAELGVDIEMIRPGPADESIAEHYFSRSESTRLRALPESLRDQAFFNCWTRKEAYIKARGDGLSLPLDHFEVTLAPGEAARLRHIVEETSDGRPWRIHSWQPAANFAAALVVEDPNSVVEHYDW